MTIRQKIEREAQGQFDPVQVRTVIKRWSTASQPVCVICDDNQQYVIKGSQNGKALYNEYVCGRLGNLFNAAVAWVRFVQIPDVLRDDPDLQHFGAGLALGSLVMPEASERCAIANVDVPSNRSRFASLAILYSWCRANDHQLLYEQIPPFTVLSNDHGHFFNGGPQWSSASLTAAGPVVRDSWFDACALTAVDFAPYWPLITAVSSEDIRRVTSAPPAEWGVNRLDRDALANYLELRKNQLQTVF